MTTNQVNAYNAAASGSSSSTSSGTSATSKLNSSSFLKLLATQMSNQDVLNPSSDTEFISQMAQFTNLETTQSMSETAKSQLNAIEALSQISYTQYGSSLVGKTVVVSSFDKDGKPVKAQGVVDNADFTSGSCVLSVNGKDYNISSVTKVLPDTQIDSLAQICYTQYGASLVGKTVVVGSIDPSTGKLLEEQGVVQSASFTSGHCELTVNGYAYNITAVMKVVTDTKQDSTGKA